MHEMLENLSERLDSLDDRIDVIADVLAATRLTTAVFGKLELGAPWRLRVPEREYLSFYVVARGGAWLDLPQVALASGHTFPARSIALSAGDAVLLPHASPHVVRDISRSETPPLDFDYDRCPRVAAGHTGKAGGDGPVTSLIAGHFTLGSGPRNALLASLPDAIHVPADANQASPQLAGIVPLIMSESTNPGPGASLVLGRLADLLLVHALRLWISSAGPNACGLRAVSDPAVGNALRLMHARPGAPWTVEKLASAVGVSRSGFAARFTSLVGESPLQYLTGWRMTKAAQMLRESDRSVAAVAEQVGYANPVAFTKAFTRLQGIGPGAYRRREAGR
jgi:AraC-like DNA-binding protein